jgi:colanic acid biosynthesis protein WcaH
MLSKRQFIALIQNAPLVSIDLIIRNPQGHILLGKRKNNPAIGYYFVPGGRIYKNESIAHALARIIGNELRLTVEDFDEIKQTRVYEHFYKNENNYDIKGVDTHYIIIAHSLKIKDEQKICVELEDNQHSAYLWMSTNALMKNELVHPNTKLYFK